MNTIISYAMSKISSILDAFETFIIMNDVPPQYFFFIILGIMFIYVIRFCINSSLDPSEESYLILISVLCTISLISLFVVSKISLNIHVAALLCSLSIVTGFASIYLLMEEYLTNCFHLTYFHLMGSLGIVAVILGLIGNFILQQNAVYAVITSLLLMLLSLTISYSHLDIPTRREKRYSYGGWNNQYSWDITFFQLLSGQSIEQWFNAIVLHVMTVGVFGIIYLLVFF